MLALLAATALFAGDPPRKFALTVGINRYEHADLRQPAPLKYAVADAAELAAELRKAGYTVVSLTDDSGRDDPRLFPSKANIERSLADLLRQCRERDTVLVAFAGHGLQFTGAEAYFCPQDARPFREETETLISLSSVYGQLQRSFAGVKVLLVDACRNDPDPGRGRSALNADAAPPPRGVAALFSSSAGQKAFEHDSLRHGVFFHHVLEGLRGAAADADGEITFEGLSIFVRKKVKLSVRRLVDQVQEPNFKGDLAGDPAVLLTVGAAARRQPAAANAKSKAPEKGAMPIAKGLALPNPARDRPPNFAQDTLPATIDEDRMANGQSLAAMRETVAGLWPTVVFRRGDRLVEYAVTLETDDGDIELELFPDVAPIHVRNFVCLAKAGFYDGLDFHRCIKDFMIQGGSAHLDGKPALGYRLRAEFNQTPHDEGVLSMARAADNASADSQFFICLSRKSTAALDGKYTVFGKVKSGMETVKRIVARPLREPAAGTPANPCKIKRAVVTTP